MPLLPLTPPELFLKKIDELMRKDLVDSLPVMFQFLGRATKWVVLGVMLEGPELGFEIVQFGKELRHKIRERADLRTLGSVFPNPKSLLADRKPVERPDTPRLILILALVGWAAVVLGVTGEWIAQDWVDDATNAIQTLDNVRLLEAQKAAGNARISAEIAAASAERVKQEADQVAIVARKALREASTAETLANSAGDKARDVEGQAAALSSRADTLGNLISDEAKRASDIEAYLRPRTISYPKGSESFEELKPFAETKVEFDVLTEVGARRAAHEIMNLLMQAGWHSPMSMKPNPELWSGPDDGVHIEYHWTREEGSFSSDPTYKAAKALEKFLSEKQGWDAHIRPSPPNVIPANTIKITVGFKPDRLFEPDWVKADREREKRRSAAPH